MNQPEENQTPPSDGNILDLRQVIEERRRTQEREQVRFRRFRRPTSPAREVLSLPSPTLDWVRFGRESLKFTLTLVVGFLVLFGGWKAVQAARVAAEVQAQAQTAIDDLQAGAAALGQLNVAEARSSFQGAAKTFQDSGEYIDQQLGIPAWLLNGTPIIGSRYRSARALLNAGHHFAVAGDVASKVIGESTPDSLTPSVQTEGIVSGTLGFLGPLLEHPDELQELLTEIESARSQLHQVEAGILPTGYQSIFRAWQLADTSLFGTSGRLENFLDVLVGLFGQNTPQEYLVVLQNNDELRATGGFPGTFFLVKLDRGTFKIIDAPTTGPYDLTDQIPHTIQPPEPIRAIAPYWAFQDSTWFLDVPTSASMLLDFYEQARGFRPDGAFFLSPQIVEDLLRVTGPIEPPGYGVEITAENFVRATEYQVEKNYDLARNNPKEFVLDLAPLLFQSIASLPAPQALQAFATVLTNGTEANIVLYSQHQAMQQTIQDLGWAGQLLPYTDDYLAIVDSNLGGGKTDRAIKTAVQVKIDLTNTEVKHQITITREHQGGGVDNELANVLNKEFIRVYTPATSTFSSIDGSSNPPEGFFLDLAPGVEPLSKLQQLEGNILVDPIRQHRITQESGLNVFGAWSILEPGQKQTITFTYTTPRANSDWHLVWQKQPGAPERTWEVQVTKDSGKLSDPVPAPSSVSNRAVHWKSNSAVNRIFSAQFTK